MNKTVTAVVLTAAVLAGCSTHRHPTQQFADQLHSQPLLTVRHGVISVAPDPIVIKRSELKGPITFLAPEGYTFPPNGIEFLGLVVNRNNQPIDPDPMELKRSAFDVNAEGRKAFDCRFDDKNPREIACHATAALRKGVYRYAMRLQKGQERIEGDPHVFAMD